MLNLLIQAIPLGNAQTYFSLILLYPSLFFAVFTDGICMYWGWEKFTWLHSDSEGIVLSVQL